MNEKNALKKESIDINCNNIANEDSGILGEDDLIDSNIDFQIANIPFRFAQDTQDKVYLSPSTSSSHQSNDNNLSNFNENKNQQTEIDNNKFESFNSNTYNEEQRIEKNILENLEYSLKKYKWLLN